MGMHTSKCDNAKIAEGMLMFPTQSGMIHPDHNLAFVCIVGSVFGACIVATDRRAVWL